MNAKRQSRRRLRIRRDELRRIGREKLGLQNDTALAEALDWDRSNLCHLFKDRGQPGPLFIAAALDMTGAKFEDLFEIADATTAA